MTQAIDDLLTLYLTFNHATVNAAITAGGGSEQLTDDPPIAIRNTFMETPPPFSVDGYILLTKEIPGTNINFGPSRHEVTFVDGHIYYESKTDKDSLVIQSIKEQLLSLMNVNNFGLNVYTYEFVTNPIGYNNIPQAGRIDFTVETWKIGVSAKT